MYGYRFVKTNRSADTDWIPAEFIKACKKPLAETITTVLNDIIDHNEFPDVWAGGLRSAVFKSGKRNVATNIRSVTILHTMEKIFEAVVHRHLAFVNEAFREYD